MYEEQGMKVILYRCIVMLFVILNILWSPASAIKDVHDENDREECGLVEEEETLSNDSLSLGEARAAIPTRIPDWLVVLRTPDSASGSETGRFAGIGTRISENIFIAANNVLYKSRWFYGHSCYQNTGYDVVSGRSLGFEFDVTKIDNHAPEFILSIVWHFAEDPDMLFIKVDPRFSDHDPNARSGAYSGIHWPRPPRLPKTTTREPEKPKPKVPVPIVQPLYAMPLPTPIQTDGSVRLGCEIHYYTLITDKGLKKAKFERELVSHAGSIPVTLPLRLTSGIVRRRLLHRFKVSPKEGDTFINMNEGAPIFCDSRLSFVVSAMEGTDTLNAVSIADNLEIINRIKYKFPNKARLPDLGP